jgi:DNA-binding MarR family transcriptional regulator
MTSAAAPDPHEIAAAVQVSIGLFMRRLRQAPVQGDLSTAQMSALSQLDRAGSATPGELARIEQITPQGIGAILAALQAAGLVQRRADPADGRRVVMSVTEAGHEVLRHKRGARTEQLAAVLSDGFTADELQTLMAATALIERLGEGI